MADIKGYSLWLEKIISSGAQASKTGALSVIQFSFSDSHNPGSASTAGIGRGYARFDCLNVSVIASGLAQAELSRAHTSGANLGRGRLDAVLTSGPRQILVFEDTLIAALSWIGRFSGESQLDLKLSIETPRALSHH
jgi:hypothetical protein